MSYNETSNMLNQINSKEKGSLDNPAINEDYLFSASCQDATGLAPTPAHDEYEAANYEELYPYLPPSPSPQETDPQSQSTRQQLTYESQHPQASMSEGIHLELRKKVEPQTHKLRD